MSSGKLGYVGISTIIAGGILITALIIGGIIFLCHRRKAYSLPSLDSKYHSNITYTSTGVYNDLIYSKEQEAKQNNSNIYVSWDQVQAMKNKEKELEANNQENLKLEKDRQEMHDVVSTVWGPLKNWWGSGIITCL